MTEPRVRLPAVVATVAVTVLVLGPLLVHGGIALRGDMVFTPDQPWKRAWLGLDGSVPRAVPMDALVSVADEVLPGGLLQRLLLVAAFTAGGLGIARLAGRFSATAQVAGVLVYLWNPWVHERLGIGQWPTVLAYGLLPWLVLAGGRLRAGGPGGWAATFVLLALAAVCAPSMGLVATLVAVATTWSERRRLLAVLGAAVLANLPWAVPALLGPGLRGSSDQFGAFAARGEGGLGTLGALLSMGGIWKVSVVPPERTHLVVVAVAGVLALAFVAGFRWAVPVLGARTAQAIVLAGAVSLLVALLPAIGPVGGALGSLAEHWPAVGIVRDSHRFLAPYGLVLGLGAAALVDRLLAARGATVVTAVLLAAAPVVLLPSLVWGLAGALRPATYPADWSRVAARVGHSGSGTVVLPWTGSYRGFGWNDRRAVLDPAPRYLPGEVLIDDRIFLRDRVLPGEDPYLRRVGAALESDDPAAALRGLGVRWVLVEKGNGVRASDVPSGSVAYDGRWLSLVDLGRPERSVADVREAPPAWPVVLGGALTAFLCFGMITHLARLWSLRRKSV
ncbi:MAG: hypothetical protein J7518_02655 [Nocardioidaceae bacterium]|nr:hypothetical protein [Nocardioidaceae bacterium]